jgi:hypothetical protein
MRRILTIGAALLFVSAMALAETYTGILVDARCAQMQKDTTCSPTATTEVFAIQVSGKMLKLDADGNKKAAEALRENDNSADRAKDPIAGAPVMATIEGTLKGDEIKVESIQVH